MMKRSAPLAALLFLLLVAGCGSDGPTGPRGPDDPANGSMTARIDGSDWRATFISPVITDGISAIGAVGGGTGGTRTIGFAWLDEGVGTYQIGVSIGFNGNLTIGTGTWVANAGERSGTLVVTTRTADRIAGTFTFTMHPGSANATGTKSVTQGAFNITF